MSRKCNGTLKLSCKTVSDLSIQIIRTSNGHMIPHGMALTFFPFPLIRKVRG